jgi:branched-chain amino acid transport system permease protein
MNPSQTTLTVPHQGTVPTRPARGDKTTWIFVAALVLLFWVPEAILYMGWAKFWITLLAEVFIWGLFAVAFNLLMGYTGMISFGQAAYLGIGSYTTGLLLKKISGFPFALGLIAAPVSGALAALIIGYFCIRLTHTYFAMLTLAFSMIVYYTAFKWYDFTGGDNGLIGIPVPAWVQDPTFANYYKFVLVVTLVSVYLLWRIVNSPFGKTLTAIRENPDRAGFVGINVKRYQLYAFIVAGAFSGLAGALFMINERSVYPELAFWTRSTQVLLMSILGGVYTFFGPIVGAFMLQLMDADITKDYPQIWQLFLGSMLVLILYGLPGGIMGFIQARDTASTDDAATRVRKAMGEFRRKFWYFFAATLFFTGFFHILQEPDTWRATLLLTAAQAVVGAVLCTWMLRQLNTLAQVWRIIFLVFPLLPLALHIALHTPLSGLMIIVLWAVFIYNYLWQAEIREAFGQPHRAALETAPGTR